MTQKYIASISVALYDRAIIAAKHGETCNVILLCAASMEAFVNELIEAGNTFIHMYAESVESFEKKNLFSRSTSTTVVRPFRTREEALIQELNKLENEREDIATKINAIKVFSDGEPWHKGSSLTFKNYNTLISIRNALMHPHSKAVEYGDNHRPKFLNDFYQQKSVTYFKEINKHKSWVEAIDTQEFSLWCLRSFEEMMKSILHAIINSNIETSPKLPAKTAEIALNFLNQFKFPER